MTSHKSQIHSFTFYSFTLISSRYICQTNTRNIGFDSKSYFFYFTQSLFKYFFDSKSYFFYFARLLFKTPFIQFSIFNSILFKYYLFINFLLLFFTQLKPNKHNKINKKDPQQLHQQSSATSAKKKKQ